MAINCNEITQVATELKMKFESCKVLEASDMDRLIELIEAVFSCNSTNSNFTNSQRINIRDNIVINSNIDNQYVNLTGNTVITSITEPSVGFTKRIKYNVITSSQTETLTLPESWSVIGTFNSAVENILIIDVSNNPIDGIVVDVIINN